MLYQVIVLVCGMGMPHGECNRDSAFDVIVAPELQTLGMCGLHGQQYLAGTVIPLDDSYVKIQCRPSTRTAMLTEGR